ncbi:MAG: hypothetical protein K9N07_01325 [Candidatus Cloacimonetes bacterium]|nr:hypothetical protein [Candidatus Cloacimonadota bacterium]
MFKKNNLGILLLLLISFMLSGCLTAEFKEYVFRINPDGSGNGSIEFINIVSAESEGEDASPEDFEDLISSYIQGNTFETNNPGLEVTSKKIYRAYGVLNGKVEFTFKDFQKIGFYHYQRSKQAPIMFYLGSLSEIYYESNGEYIGGEEEKYEIPMLVWAPGTSEFTFTTQLQNDMTNTHSLLDSYNEWNEGEHK